VNGPRVAVVVLTKDGREHLLPGLSALFSSAIPAGGLEVVLVDNGSTDGSADAARRAFPRLKVIRNERNVGFARGVHQGAAATGAKVLILVNDDAVVEPDAICALVEALDSGPPSVVATAGLLTDGTGERIDFVDGLVTFDGHALQRGFGRPVAGDARLVQGGFRLFPCGGFCALRRDEFERLGGFDESFFAYLEDVDFGWRATLAGRTTLFVPGARARHLSGATGMRLGLARRGVLIESNAFSVAYKNLEAGSLSALLPAICATFQHRAWYGLLAGRPEIQSALGDPFAEPSPGRRGLPEVPGLRPPAVRLLRWLAGVAEPAAPSSHEDEAPIVIEHEVGRMWLVAWNRIVASWPELAAKRRAVQTVRRLPDQEVFRDYPLHLVATYPGDAEFFASDFFRTLLPAHPELVATSLEDVAAG
jgi:GT2 family glycosyltransferase